MWQNPSKVDKKTGKRFNFQPVTSAVVEKSLKCIKRSKSTGLDDIPPGLLKDSAAVISLPLAHIINLLFSTGVLPTQWKNTRIVPVHKSGDQNQVWTAIGQYRYGQFCLRLSKNCFINSS